MYVDSITLSYLFFIIGIVFLLFSLYFKLQFIKTSPSKNTRRKLLSKAKDPIVWREMRNLLSKLSLFWGVSSMIFFLYLNFIVYNTLTSITYLLVYCILILVSLILFISLIKKKASI